jgi:hypothetical protein
MERIRGITPKEYAIIHESENMHNICLSNLVSCVGSETEWTQEHNTTDSGAQEIHSVYMKFHSMMWKLVFGPP